MSTAIGGRAPQVIDAAPFRLRHIAPTATWASEGSTATLLGRTYGFTELPMSHLPTSPDLVEGSYTGRLGDAGEFTLTFPNVASSKGLWRERFSADLSLEFIEIYRDDVLEFVGSIQRVEVERASVTVSGTDAWALLRRAYEQDRTWTAAPQEVVKAYTRVPVTLIADDFDGAALSGSWTTSGTVSVANGRVRLSDSAAAFFVSLKQNVTFSSDTWRLVVSMSRYTGDDALSEIDVSVANNTGTLINIAWVANLITFGDAGTSAQLARTDVPSQNTPHTFVIERKGRWVSAYVDGRFVGVYEYYEASGAPTYIQVSAGGGVSAITMDIDSVTLTEQQNLLARGSDLGDYVLPTDQPTGGLRGRYFDDADKQGISAAGRAYIILAPDRVPYAERLDPVMNTAAGLSLPVQPGNSGDYFSVRWFGSIYLRGDLGNYTFETTSVVDGVRLWVGKTGWGDQLIDDWTTASGTNTATWTAANYGSLAGWYPIVVEYFCDTAAPVFRLQFTRPSTYTDPGGTSISAKMTVPSTSLSPLGCYDNRVQGTSHFDMVQGAAQQFGYQLRCEPMQLESGEFPGRLVPRLRVGRDTDVVLAVEDVDGVEPALSPKLTLDGSDQAVSLVGSGAGLADGKGSQVSAEIFDASLMTSALFNLQAVVDAADIAFPDLLGARLSAELALRGTPWEEVAATPRAQEQLADTWPLSQVLAAMRWYPGDGLRISVPDIGVEDADPRQMLQVTRAFAAEGRTGTTASFRQRPRSAARTVRGLLRAAIAAQRSYQGQRISLMGAFTNVAGGTTAAAAGSEISMMPLLPTDQVVGAKVRLVYNSAAQSLGLNINGTGRTSEVGGGWTTVPVDIDITGYARQASTTDNRLYVQFVNNGGVATIIQYQLVVEVLR